MSNGNPRSPLLKGVISMKKLSPIIAAVALLTAANAQADFYKSKPYVGGNLAGNTLSITGVPDDLSLLTGYARFGAQFDDYFALEWRIGAGLQDDDAEVMNAKTDINLDLFYGAYVLGGIPITEYFYPYALIGYTKAELELNSADFASEYKEGDISFGVGVNFDVSNQFAINLEYLQYIEENGVELSGPTLGFLFYF
jgi:opacity protein-like surface antigen